MASRKSMTGLTDYSRTKASVRRHDTFVKRTFLGSSQSSLLFDEEEDFSDRPKMTMQEFRQSLIRPEDEEGEVTFQLRINRKRLRNGSTHSLSKGKYIYTQDDQGHYSKVVESPKTPSRTLSGKSKILVRAPSHENFGQSTEDISAYGYASTSPRRGGKKESVTMDEVEGRNKSSLPVMLGEVSESEQTEMSGSEQSITYEIDSDSTQSASLSSSCTLGGLRKSRNTSATSSQTGNPIMPAHLQTSCPSISEDNSDDETPIKQRPARERPIFAGFGPQGYVRPSQTRNPSDSDESFTSFAKKYSRFSKPIAVKKPQKSDADSCMDLHESFSSFASFAEDEDWANKSVGHDKLLDGDEESEEEEEDEEEEISLGDQSPDSVIVDLTSVSTSVNSNSQSLSLSLSPRSSSKASLSRERRSVVPLNDTAGTRHKRDDKRIPRHRRDATDGCSVGSAISRHSNRSGGSWLSKHSKKSTNSRFSRLEEYLNKDSNRDRLGGSKEASSRERKDDISTTSSLTMGTFRTNETKDSWKKLSDVVESKEVPNLTALKKEEGASLKHIQSNPFLAADRRNNIPVKNSYDSPRKTTKVWKPPQSPEKTSPIKTSSVKVNPGKEAPKHPQSPTKTPGSSPRKLATVGKFESPVLLESPTKTPATTPRKLAMDRMSPFANGNTSVPDIARVGVARGKSYESPVKRPLSSSKAPHRSSSSDGRLGGLREITCAPLSSPRRTLKSLSSPASGSDVVSNENPETTKPAPRSWKKAPSSSVSSKVSTQEPEPKAHYLHKEKNNEPKVATIAKQLKKPVQPVTPTKGVDKGINLFNPSATSTGPTKQNFPRFVGDHVNPGSLSVKSSTKMAPSPDLKPVPTGKDCPEDAESKKAPGSSAPKKESKVQSYLKKFKEQNPMPPTNNLLRDSSIRSSKLKETVGEQKAPESVPQSPKKGDRNTAIKGAVRSPTSSKAPRVKLSSAPVPSSGALFQNKSENPKKPSRQGPAASRVRIDLFLEKNKKSNEEEDVFQEPVPSPWRPSTTSGRNRLRASDSNSRASSIASSKCSTGSARTSAVSMFQPHRQVSVTSLPGSHSPTRASGNKSVVSFDGSVGNRPKLSLIEQRKRMLQSGNQSKAMTSITEQTGNVEANFMASLTLPSASEISGRVSTWHNTSLLAD